MTIITPKVLIISHFDAEAKAWQNEFGLQDGPKVAVPGLFHEFPEVASSPNSEVSLLTTGMGLINASLAISALTSSPLFDLRKTYFLIAGIGGVNPKVGTLGSVVLAKYVIQIDLQYEIDHSQTPSDWASGYIPQGATSPLQPPTSNYGTEVFALDQALQNQAYEWAKDVELLDAPEVREYCQSFRSVSDVATQSPMVTKADVTASNVFFHGAALSQGFANACQVFGKHFVNKDDVVYGITAQEDSGTLAALHRAASQGKLQTSRIVLMRTASNFDQPPPNHAIEFPIHYGHGGFGLSIENIRRAGVEIVNGLLEEWK